MERMVLFVIVSIVLPIVAGILILMAVQATFDEINNVFETANGGYYEKVQRLHDPDGRLDNVNQLRDGGSGRSDP